MYANEFIFNILISDPSQRWNSIRTYGKFSQLNSKLEFLMFAFLICLSTNKRRNERTKFKLEWNDIATNRTGPPIGWSSMVVSTASINWEMTEISSSVSQMMFRISFISEPAKLCQCVVRFFIDNIRFDSFCSNSFWMQKASDFNQTNPRIE